jgi:predicted dehydrogenase
METVRLIQVGLGVMGKSWLRLISATPRTETVAWVDADPNCLKALVAEGKAQADHCYVSFEEALAREDAHGVLVATPPELHESVCVAAARAGLHILCEKPLADSMEAAVRAVEAAEQAGVILMVAQNRRHTPFIHTMRQLVQAQKYGRSGQAFVHFHQIFTRASFRDTMAHPLLVDMANHHFDAIRCVFGQEPNSVVGAGWNPPWSRFHGIGSAVLVFDYADGLHVVYEGTWQTIDVAMTANGCDWRIECERGVITCQQEVVFAAAADHSPTGSFGVPLQPVEMMPMTLQGGAYLLDEFLDAIGTGRVPETSGRDNLKTLAMVYAAVEAVDTGRRIQMPL